jgi:hypothetical protein
LKETKPGLLLRICWIIFSRWFGGGLLLAAGLFVASLFQTGVRAQATRIMCVLPIAVCSLIGLLQVGWTLLVARQNR